jgi:hypothetical protein
VEQPIMPEIHIGVSDVARAALDGLKWLVSLPERGYPSEYPKHPERRGAAAMLDAALEPDLNGYGEIADSLRG